MHTDKHRWGKTLPALMRGFAVVVMGVAAHSFKAQGAEIDFAREVQPILAAKCIECHGADVRKGGLRLDLKRDALMGGD
ncbi:MAG: c-type cytochrome domain-containing protein, partial [Verrucomicrobiota bacterium]